MPSQSPVPSHGPASAGKGLVVLQVIPRMQAGGAERTTVEITTALTARGDTALVATAGGRLLAEIEAAGGEPVILPVDAKSPWAVWRNRARLMAVIRARGVDVVHARSRAPAWSALWAARACGVPFVTTYHGTYTDQGALKRFYNSVMARGDRVIANSRFIAERIARTYDLPAERLAVIPRGVDPALFDPAAVTPDRLFTLREAWGLTQDGRPIVLLPARLTGWKGHLVLIEAVRRLSGQEAPGFVTVLAGDPERNRRYGLEIDAAVAAAGLAGHVKRPGHCADMAAAYALADVVVSPATAPEAFGRVAIEAQAMGRPVIVADHGGARETVIDGKTGWRVAPGDAAALARALSNALALGPEARAALGARARQHSVETYSVHQMCVKTLHIYDQLAQASAAGQPRRQPAQA